MQTTIYQNLQSLLHYTNSAFSPNNIKTVIIGPDGLIVGYHVNKIMSFKAHTVENLMRYNAEPKAKHLLKALHDGIQFPSVEEVIVIMPTNQQVFNSLDCSPAGMVRNSSYTLEGLKHDYKRLRYFTVATSANPNTMPTLFNVLAQQGLNKPGLAPKTISQFISECGMQVDVTPVHSDTEYYLDSGISIKSREMYPQMDGAQGELNLYFQKVKNHLQAQQDKATAAAAAASEKNLVLKQAENLDNFIQIMKTGVLNSKIPENMKYKIFSTEAYETLKTKVYKYPKFIEKAQTAPDAKKFIKQSASEIVEDVAHACRIKLKYSLSETAQKVLEGETSLANEAVRRLKALVDVEPDAKLNRIAAKINALQKVFPTEGSILIDKAAFLRLSDTYELSIAENNVYAYKKNNETDVTYRVALADKTSSFDLDKAAKDIVIGFTEHSSFRGNLELTNIINLNNELRKCNLKASTRYIPSNATLKKIITTYKDNLLSKSNESWSPEDTLTLYLIIAMYS